MDQVQKIPAKQQEKSEDRDVSLIDLMITLAKRKRLVMGLPITIAILATAVSFLLPNVYQANAKLLPPQQSQGGAAALLSQLGGAAGLALGGGKTSADLYIGILKSRTVADRLIEQYDLKKIYGTEFTERARKKLEENTTISAGKDGIISIEVEDEDQKRVAKLTNSYVQELIKLTRTLAITEAAQRRVFFEGQLELAKNNLANAEIALKQGLYSRGVISVDVESRAIAETVARLRAEISVKEIQLNSMRPFMTESHPDYRKAQEEQNSLRVELTKLENGRDTVPGSGVKDGEKPAGLENIKLLRDVKYYQMLYELLAKQYEAARLEEAKDPAIVQVLDPAIEPERKFKPKRTFIILFSTIFAALLAVGLALASEAKRRALEFPEFSARWSELRTYLRLRK
jgi:tyrosine-protein kinase Etk/Wzc